MEEAEKATSQAAQVLERRGMPRCAVDAEVSVALVSLGITLAGRIVDLSAGGCRMVLAERLPAGMHAAVEVSFRLRGIAFRLSGVTEWTAGGNIGGMSFAPISPRRRDDLLEVLCEVEAANAARAAAAQNAAKPQTAGEPGAARDDAAKPKAAEDAQAADRRERRVEARCGVDTSAAIHLVKIKSKLAGQVCDLSLSGCRIRTTERFPVGIYTRIEIEFRLEGMPLLLGGVVQAIHGRSEVGIRFLDVSARKQEQLAELIAEVRERQNALNAG
jgi:c-di-GMP-binding flagellar brake protein YcgR